MAGFLAAETWGGNQADLAVGRQLGIQFGAAFGVAVFTALATWAILKVVDAIVGLRVSEQEETDGLDVVSHEESGYRY
jgi:Amt family ammonium transporter